MAQILLFPTYLATIKNSIGTHMFRNVYAEIEGSQTDITRDGALSCAVYVSSLLKLFNLIKENHATVTKTVADLEQSGWVLIDKPRIGCVLVWEAKTFHNNETHTHIGFYVDEHTAISNSAEAKTPTEHHWTWGADQNGKPIRKVTAMYWNSKLEEGI